MNINSTSTYTYGSSASKGMSGLASGLDTESLVKEMLSGTQSKIDAQKALKQQTEWKQEIYRDLIQSINTFQSSYFSASSPTSLTSSALYNTMSATSASKNFTVSASTSTPVGNTSLEVHQLASNYSISSALPVSGRLAGKMDAEQLQALVDAQRSADRTLVLKVGAGDRAQETDVKIDLKQFFVKNDSFLEEIDADGIAAEIQSQLKSQAGLDAKVSIAGGQLSIVSKDGDRALTVSSDSTQQALDVLGLTASTAAKPNRAGTQRTMTSRVNLTPSLDFKMTLDDSLQKEISLDVRELVDADGKLDLARLDKTMSDALDRAFGKDVVRVSRANGSLELSASVAGRKITVNSGSNKEVLSALGLKNGQSNRIAAYNTLKEVQLTAPLQGSRFRFEINGAQFSFSEDDDIDYVLNTINSSEAGVTVVYKPLSDTFVMTANDGGAGREIRMSQSEGNLLNVMFGAGDGTLKTGGTAVSNAFTVGGQIANHGKQYAEGIKSGLFTLTVNEKEYNLDIAAKADGSAYTLQELVDAVNGKLRSQFGTREEGGEDVQNIELTVGEDSNLSLTVRNGAAVELAGVNAAADDEEALKKLAQEGNLAVALGLVTNKDGATNVISEKMMLKDAGLSALATQLGIADTVTLAGLKEATKDNANFRVSFEDGRFVVSAVGDAARELVFGNDAQTQELFGTQKLTLNGDAAQKAVISEGRNAIVRIDGMLTERSSNVFSYNGMTVELNAVSKAAEGGGAMQPAAVYVRDEATGELKDAATLEPKIVPPEEGTWIDAEGYLRSSGGDYLTATGEAAPNRATARRYDLVFRDANGSQITGVGINSSGALVDASGNALQARETETIQVTRDTDKVVDGIKGFIDEYNKLVKTISDYLTEDANYRDYAPLTEEQREEMSEKQIELWEEKAKEGLLRRDSILDGFLQSMRSIWYETNSSGYAIYQLGIETGDWATRGQLSLSVDGEATLRQMLANDPTGVMNFFANSTDGAAMRVNSVIKEVANTSSGSPGTLVQMAGLKGYATEKNNTLYEKIKDIDERIERLKNQYEQEKDRYWKQFNTMEQLIANMNSQSMWLSQQFSY